METGIMKVKTKDGKVDTESIERNIKRKIPGYQRYDFDYSDNKVWVKAWKEGMPEDVVELFLFQFFK